MKRLILLALGLAALTACEESELICQPIIQDDRCMDDYEHFSVCCDPEFVECQILFGYKDPEDTGFLENGEPNFRDCGTYFDCMADLDRIENYCLTGLVEVGS